MRHSDVVTSYCYSLGALNPVERKESQCYSSCSTLPLSRGRSLTGERKGIRRNSTGKRPIDNVSVESAQLNKQTSSKSIDYAECTKSPRAEYFYSKDCSTLFISSPLSRTTEAIGCPSFRPGVTLTARKPRDPFTALLTAALRSIFAFANAPLCDLAISISPPCVIGSDLAILPVL